MNSDKKTEHLRHDKCAYPGLGYYLLFKVKGGATTADNNDLPDGFRYHVFRPTLQTPIPAGWFQVNINFFDKLKVIVVFYYLRMFCWASGRKPVLLYVVYKEGKPAKLVHYCFLKSFDLKRLSALTVIDVELGPYWTDDQFRDRSIASAIVRKIIANKKDGQIYVITNRNNLASIRVIQKAGFEFLSACHRRKGLFLLSHYVTDQQLIAQNNDKKTEHLRYDNHAQSLLTAAPATLGTIPIVGSLMIPTIYRAPYIIYEKCINMYIRKEDHVLELCSGTGLHTYALTQAASRVVVSDISRHSLDVLAQRIKGVTILVADIESLPFEDSSFDVVAIAGSLSYGDPDLVDAEVQRVLRPGGTFLCVDSLNHNQVYRFNRMFQYLIGNRTKSTLLRMPTMERIQLISQGFKSTEVHFFGAVSYLMPILALIIGQSHAAKVSDTVDRLVHVSRAAFKFVLVARGRL